MAAIIKKVRELLATPAGVVIEAVVYAAMIIFVLMFFTGNGQFIYEAF